MNFRQLDLNLLRVFDTVMAERNLTRAAEQLSLTQPAISSALKRLRESVGEDLLTRVAFGVKPTARAEALWPEVRAALAQLRAAFDPGEFQPQLEPASFRLTMSDAISTTLMPQVVSQIESIGAQTNLRVVPPATLNPRAMLERDDVDVAVGHFPDTVASIGVEGRAATLRHRRLYDSQYVCVMRRGHPLAGRALTLDAFCGAHHLLVSFSGSPFGLVDETLGALGRTRRIVLTVNQYYTAGRVVARSDLLTVLPAFFVEATGRRADLVEQPLPFELAGIHVEMIWHLRHDRTSAHRWLRERLVEAAAAALGEVPAAGPEDV